MSNWERSERIRLALEPPNGVDVRCVKCDTDLPNVTEARVHLRRNHQMSPADADALMREFPVRGNKAAKAEYERRVHGKSEVSP